MTRYLQILNRPSCWRPICSKQNFSLITTTIFFSDTVNSFCSNLLIRFHSFHEDAFNVTTRSKIANFMNSISTLEKTNLHGNKAKREQFAVCFVFQCRRFLYDIFKKYFLLLLERHSLQERNTYVKAIVFEFIKKGSLNQEFVIHICFYINSILEKSISITYVQC